MTRQVWLSALVLASLLVFHGTAFAADALSPVDVRQVKVGGEIGRRIEVTCRNNLMVLDLEKDFLAVPEEGTRRRLHRAGQDHRRGSTIGCTYRRPSRRRAEARAGRRRDRCTGAGRIPGARAADARVFELWDIHEMGYLIYGLTLDYRFFGEKASLEAARKLADYLIERWSADPERKPGGGRSGPHGRDRRGIGDARLALRHGGPPLFGFLRTNAEAARLERPDRHRPARADRRTCLCPHVPLHRPTAAGQAAARPRLLKPAHDVIDFLTGHNGLVITGACGDHECWHDTQEGTLNLGETCATSYLIRMLDELLRMEGKPLYGDLMERSIYNALFAAQSPDGRQIRYYSPFDGPREYFQGDTYCCPCNYRRIVAELPGMICYRAADGVAVNLYTPSTVQVPLAAENAVTVRQETKYPHDGLIVLNVDPVQPAEFKLQLRVPRWCDAPAVAVNGEPLSSKAQPGELLAIHRRWKAGDTVRLEMPMKWRLVKGRQAQAGRVAVMRGPLVFCLSRAKHEKLAKVDLRLIVIDPDSLQEPVADDAVHPGGLACRLQAWEPGAWYPMSKKTLDLTLTEFADPAGEAVYFKVPDPNGAGFVDDELCGGVGR